MKMKWNQVIKVKGTMGKAVNPKPDGSALFLPEEHGYYSEKDLMKITEKDLQEISIEDEDGYFFNKNMWLGKPVKVHRIGEYKIIEYKEKDNTNKITEKSMFSPQHDYNLNNSWYSLDEALLHCILHKHGEGIDVVLFISKILNKRDGVK